jgi:hypothetical protein
MFFELFCSKFTLNKARDCWCVRARRRGHVAHAAQRPRFGGSVGFERANLAYFTRDTAQFNTI